MATRKSNYKDKSIPKLIKKPRKEGKYLAHGDNGRTYPATKVNDYMPGGVMFFAIPADVKILGYTRVQEKAPKGSVAKTKTQSK